MDRKEWTIMIYMAGDNNLSVDMAYALKEIREASGGRDNSPNVFVYYDGNSPLIPTLYCDFSDPENPQYIPSASVRDKLYPASNKENENAADIHSVYNFIDWCVNKAEVVNGSRVSYGRRADHYALILAGHSLGFQDIGLFRDEGSGRSMKMDGLKKGFERIVADENALRSQPGFDAFDETEKKRESTKLVGQKLDILGFDSCVMGMLEVGYQFAGIADTMIASEGSLPSAGWTYASILDGEISGSNGKSSGRAVAEDFVRKFISGQDDFTVGGVSVDVAAWDLTKLPDLARAFDKLSEKLLECFKEKDSYIYRQMERALLQAHWKSQTYMYDQNVDLGDFCELLERECSFIIKDLDGKDTSIFTEISDLCRSVRDRLGDAVILSGISGGAYQFSNGISVFFPWSLEGYDVSRRNYKSLWISKDGGSNKFSWKAFLEKYLGDVSRRAEPTDPTGKDWYHLPYNFDGISNEASGTGSPEGQAATRMPGTGATRLPGHPSTRLAGTGATRLAGTGATRLPGTGATRLPGTGATRLGAPGSNQFFDFLRLFKNIESPWNVSGFTKKPAEKSMETST